MSVHRGNGVSVLGGSLSWGGLCPGGVSVLGGSLCREVSVRETTPYGKERAVHILLECILVFKYLHLRDTTSLLFIVPSAHHFLAKFVYPEVKLKVIWNYHCRFSFYKIRHQSPLFSAYPSQQFFCPKHDETRKRSSRMLTVPCRPCSVVYHAPCILRGISTVTNITFTGSSIVNWNRGLLIQGVTIVIVVNVHALGHFVGCSASIKGSRSPRHCKQTRLG